MNLLRTLIEFLPRRLYLEGDGCGINFGYLPREHGECYGVYVWRIGKCQRTWIVWRRM